MNYIILFVLFIGLELVYFKIADRFNIIDKPNNRSSHTSITLRGGGIIFPLAIIVAFFLGYVSWMVVIAVLLVAVISFIDDIRPLSQLPRFASHTIAVSLIFYSLGLFDQAIWILPILFILTIGWVNIFNFMDGINGITVLYAFVTILSFSFLKINYDSIPLLITMGLSCCAFGFFNVRKKAKTFAGDVGSISMALFLGYFMLKTIFGTGQIEYILFISLYGIDGILTIVARIKRKENIFEPHRSHLYQYLANELKYPHIAVSVLYAVIQLLLNGVTIYLVNIKASILEVVLFLVLQVAVYLFIRNRVLQKVNLVKEQMV
ncbi:UDP-GlcNAc--UDP-phosphate GlcNAc-1-phosphate transferase [Flavobacterium adhaerens]|uniref:UDP-GlcNAc--UDP-phosphate GlcNAc-1-phosphate transferase n=1 Tax=Flavobacterium adhaerens TaxID=3149043 RepID=UPI0032B31E6B